MASTNFTSVLFRLYPSRSQEETLSRNCGCTRFVYNYVLGKMIEYYKNTGKHVSCGTAINQLPNLKEKFEWLKEADSQSLQQVIRNLDQAYRNFFRRLKQGGPPGFPKFKKKGVSRDSFRCTSSSPVRLEGTKLKVGKHGFIQARGNLKFLADKKIKSITISRHADRWYAACLVEAVRSTPHIHRHEICGVDLGVKRPLTTAYSNLEGDEKSYWFGKKFSLNLARKEARRKHYQRQLARKQKNSKNREKAKLKVQRAFLHEMNCRREFQEQVSHVLAYHFRTIVFEALKIRSMTRNARGTVENPGTNVRAKAGLNREMLRLGLSSVVTRTQQKATYLGGEVIFVSPHYTSQMCNCCGSINRENRKSQAKFKCIECGHTDNADRNAARNIRDLGTASLAA